MKTIDATPTWIALNPVMLELAAQPKTRVEAKKHFDHMAKVADKAVEYESKLVAIEQRIQGDYDAPELRKYLPDGPSADMNSDIIVIINK
jgi:hypothetical protein